MEFSAAPSLQNRKKADLLVLPFWRTDKGVAAGADFGKLEGELHLPLELEDFKGKEGEALFLYPPGIAEKRVALLGLGKRNEITLEKLRRAYSSIVKECLCRKIDSLNVCFPELEGIREEAAVYAIAEGMLLSNYAFEKLKGDSFKDEKTSLLKSVSLIGASHEALKGAKKAVSICEAVYFARDLVNGNADDITPQALADTAKSLSRKFKSVKAQVFDKKRIVKEKMGLLLAVNKASALDPAFIILEYKGNP